MDKKVGRREYIYWRQKGQIAVIIYLHFAVFHVWVHIDYWCYDWCYYQWPNFWLDWSKRGMEGLFVFLYRFCIIIYKQKKLYKNFIQNVVHGRLAHIYFKSNHSSKSFLFSKWHCHIIVVTFFLDTISVLKSFSNYICWWK